jgi:predicted nucleic acid-binding protein
MKKMKIYLDTSIISAYFDYRKPVRQLITQKWFQNDIGNFDTYISSLVVQEINNNKDLLLMEKMFELISEYEFSVLEIDKDSLELAELYRREVIKKEVNDSIHIAIAAINSLDAVISWNFKHIVNLKTINTIHSINLLHNYKIVEIMTPENLGGNVYANL